MTLNRVQDEESTKFEMILQKTNTKLKHKSSSDDKACFGANLNPSNYQQNVVVLSRNSQSFNHVHLITILKNEF